MTERLNISHYVTPPEGHYFRLREIVTIPGMFRLDLRKKGRVFDTKVEEVYFTPERSAAWGHGEREILARVAQRLVDKHRERHGEAGLHNKIRDWVGNHPPGTIRE